MPASSLRRRSLLSSVTPRRSASAPESVDFPLPGRPPTRVRPTAEARRWRRAVVTSRRDAVSAPGAPWLGLDQRDLGPDERAVGDVVVPQGGRCRVAGVLAVLGEEERRGLRGAELFQVHGEEGGVVEAVDVAEAVVELQAVQDAGAVVEAEDVLGEQVAVAVDHPPLLDRVSNRLLAAGEIAAHQPLDLLHAVGRGAVVGRARGPGRSSLPSVTHSASRVPCSSTSRLRGASA